MRKYLPYLLGTLVVFLAIVAAIFLLYQKKLKESGPIVLHYAGLWDPEVFNSLKEKYQKTHPDVVIEYEQKDQDRYFSYLTKAIGTANGPDLFWWHNSWGPVLQKQLAPLPESIYPSATYEKTFYPITKANLKINGTYRGIPLEIDGLALAYNKDLLATKGFSAPPADLISLKNNYAPPLTIYDQSKQVKVGGVALGAVNNIENFSEIVGLFLLQNKVAFIKNRQNTLAANISLDGRNLAADALEVYNSFLVKDKVWSTALPPSIEAFATGKVAMIYLSAAGLVQLKTYLDEAGLQLNFGVSPVPQLVSSDPVSWGSYWVNGVAAASKYKQQAWELAKFLSEKDSLRQLSSSESKIRGLGRAYPRVDMANEQVGDSLLYPYVVQAPYAQDWYLHADTGDSLLNDKIVEVFKKRMAESPTGEQTGTIFNIAKDLQPILQKSGLVNALAKGP